MRTDEINSIINEIKEKMPDIVILRDEPMKEHTTFRCGGNAALFLQPKSKAELVWMMQVIKKAEIPWYVTGNGSNLLVSDKGYDGAVINTLLLKDTDDEIIIKESPDKDGAFIEAGAGVLLSRVSQEAMQHSLTGLEFASGIPGSVGGAVVMNAGAYGGEISYVLHDALNLHSDGSLKLCVPDELKLGYRDSIYKHEKHVCIRVTFLLKNGDREEIKATMQDMNDKRRAKQPLEFPSAGSTFKRPEGNFAGKLIMEAGLAGYAVGGAQVSEKHCGFIINKGGATAGDIKKLMDHVTKAVYENSGVMLEPEVCLIGDFG